MPVTSFIADPQVIKHGQSTTLKWTTDGCDDCVILPPMTPIPVDSSGSMEVSPEVSTVYMIQCKCSEEPNEWTCLVEVER